MANNGYREAMVGNISLSMIASKAVLSLSALANKWQQFWDKINQFGADVSFIQH